MFSGIRFEDVSGYFFRLRQGMDKEAIEQEVLRPICDTQDRMCRMERAKLLTVLREGVQVREQENERYLVEAEKISLTQEFQQEVSVARKRLQQMSAESVSLTQAIEQRQQDLAREVEGHARLQAQLQQLRMAPRVPQEPIWINREHFAQWAAKCCQPKGTA